MGFCCYPLLVSDEWLDPVTGVGPSLPMCSLRRSVSTSWRPLRLPLLAATGFSRCALAHNLAPIRLRACIDCAQALRKHIHGSGNELHSRSAARVLSLSGLRSWRIEKSLPGTTVTLDGKAIIENGQLKI